tara:strand:- start:250883 stop:251047 length:165 start_codon:yes stop_codon:yes gene_type:complete
VNQIILGFYINQKNDFSIELKFSASRIHIEVFVEDIIRMLPLGAKFGCVCWKYV